MSSWSLRSQLSRNAKLIHDYNVCTPMGQMLFSSQYFIMNADDSTRYLSLALPSLHQWHDRRCFWVPVFGEPPGFANDFFTGGGKLSDQMKWIQHVESADTSLVHQQNVVLMMCIIFIRGPLNPRLMNSEVLTRILGEKSWACSPRARTCHPIFSTLSEAAMSTILCVHGQCQ